MKNAGAGTNQATYDGYLILRSVGNKYDGNTDPDAPFSTSNATALSIALLKCMNTGGATAPDSTVLKAALGVHGAFGVRGLSSSEPSLLSHDGFWILEPPGGQPSGNWQQITILSTGITDTRIAKAFLAYGVPSNYTASTFTNDVLINPTVFDWATLPTATFDTALGGIVVGECKSESNFLQHLPVTSGAEVLGFVEPSCYEVVVASGEAAPRNLAERLFRMISPEPAYALLRTTTGSGGSKGSLSPFGLVDPGVVALKFSASPSFKGNTTNKLLKPTPVVGDFTNAGTPFLQASALTYLQGVTNNGTPGQICWNWAYTDNAGVATFSKATITKAGGYQLNARTVGTLTSPDGTLEPVPPVAPGTPVLSKAFNLKNDNSLPGVCPVFDGTYFYPDIVGQPSVRSQVFPPTY